MLIEAPGSTIREARAKAALLIGAAELEAMRIRQNSKNEAARRIREARKEIMESNHQLLAGIRDELSLCSQRETAELRRKSREMHDRATGRMDGAATYLNGGFDRFLAALSQHKAIVVS